MNENKTLINISKKSFFSVVIILVSLMIVVFILTYVIPQGAYSRDVDGNIIADTFQFTDSINLPIYKLLIAPFMVFASEDSLIIIMICLFLLVLGGFFQVMDNTNGIKAIIRKMIERFQNQKYTLIRIMVLIFMAFGAFFGIFEESVALLPIIILLSLSLGFDTLLALGMTVLAAGFGFATAITNPFSVGVASEIAGTNILAGGLYRILIFGVMYFLLSTFLVRYAKKIDADPTKSLTYENDIQKSHDFQINSELVIKDETKIFKTYTIVFAILIGVIIISSLLQLVFQLSIPTIPLMAGTFLIGGFVSGWIVTKKMSLVGKAFLKGMLSVLPALLMIMLAASVKWIITEGQIIDTILHALETFFADKPAVLGILGIYFIILFLEFFIGSASAKAFLIMPILIPLVSLLGITKNLTILAFIFGDGYTNVIFPTNAVLLISLSIANVSYSKWFKWTYKLQLITLFLAIIFLIIGLFIGY